MGQDSYADPDEWLRAEEEAVRQLEKEIGRLRRSVSFRPGGQDLARPTPRTQIPLRFDCELTHTLTCS
jgi:hypothetical protein